MRENKMMRRPATAAPQSAEGEWKRDYGEIPLPLSLLIHGYASKEGCWTELKSRNLDYAMGVRLTGFTT
jgi:hypothetical protein